MRKRVYIIVMYSLIVLYCIANFCWNWFVLMNDPFAATAFYNYIWMAVAIPYIFMAVSLMEEKITSI